MSDYCEPCGLVHGPLYVCEHYSDAKKAEMKAASDRWIANLMDPEWVEAEMAKGVPSIAITMARIFAGIDPDEIARNQ